MSVGLLLPLGLIALAGLLVPLLVHLIRQAEHKVIDFPALRWLRESVRRRRRLRFDDRWLLAARLLLIALIALLMAWPVLGGDWRVLRQWIVVSDGVDLDAAQRELPGITGEWRWLAPGFPAVDGDAPSSPQPFASLLREFDATLATDDQLTVLVPGDLAGLDGERIRLAHAVDWRVVPARIELTQGTDEKPLRVALRYADADLPALRYLHAALAAWAIDDADRWQVDERAIGSAVDPATDWLIWLGGELPAALTPWIERGGRVLQIDAGGQGGEIVWKNSAGLPLASARRVGSGQVISLLQPLAPARMPELLDADFPERLRSLLEGRPVAPTRAWADAVRPAKAEGVPGGATTSLSPLLGLLIALVFLVERVLATRTRGLA